MGKTSGMTRLLWTVAAAVVLCSVLGCSPLMSRAKEGGTGDAVASYFIWRFEDLFETIDLGFSLSEQQYGGLYGHFASLTPFGVSYVDGRFFGIGGGQIGYTKYYQAGVGALAWGYEEMGWQEFDKNDLSTVQALGVGPLGLLTPPYGSPVSAPS